MSENIKVYQEILKVQLAYSDGWKEAAGHKVVVQEIEFSFVITGENNPVIKVSSLEGGVLLTTIPYNPLLLFFGLDKNGTLQMIEEKAEIVSKIIDKNGKNTILKMIKEYKEKYESEFGKMPPIELFDMSNVPEEVKEVLNESL